MKSNITITHKDKVIGHDKFLFSGGEVQVRLRPIEKIKRDDSPIIITANIYDSDGIMELFLLTDALQRFDIVEFAPVHLVIPYLPYARQDRSCHPGEAFSLDVMLRMLRRIGYYEKITVYDVHSDVALTGTKIENLTAVNWVKEIPTYYDAIVAPDKGAYNRALLCATERNNRMLVGEKIRDPNDGKITGVKVAYNGAMIDVDRWQNVSLLIVDDICDGGRTFIEIAKVLKPVAKKIDLYVTHGIFSNGLKVFGDLIDTVYTANLFPNKHDVSDVKVLDRRIL